MLRLNSDLGESFGPWKMGTDEAVMPLVDMANIACGFHASDPLTMQYT
ncbi:MAG: LamB/YcsF family protein, partial [Campylobacterales bacterium]|nr:LamB/YcsF family protein [Campylobacterales bacterium]